MSSEQNRKGLNSVIYVKQNSCIIKLNARQESSCANLNQLQNQCPVLIPLSPLPHQTQLGYHTHTQQHSSAIHSQHLVYVGKVLIESFEMLVSNVYIFLPTYFSYTANQVQADSDNSYYILLE